MVTVFADKYLFKITEIVPEGLDLRLYDPEEGLPRNLDQADALLIRTVTNINKNTLNPVPKRLKFLGTGSAGTDHVDTQYLREHNIKFAYSPGCNADSVAEYVVTGLLIWAEQMQLDLNAERIGIVGVGHVGSALQDLLDRVCWNYLLYDPPRSRRDKSFTSAGLSELLNCSILTFHTPLNRQGTYSTYHWLNGEKLSGHSYKLVINTARGGVVDETALLESMQTGAVGDIIIDVWENEPDFNDQTARKAFLATPHIAGYSTQSKYRASKMIVEAMAEHLSIDIPDLSLPDKRIPAGIGNKESRELALSDILQHIHPIKKYQNALEELIGLSSDSKQKGFNRLRTSLPYRNEYPNISLPDEIRLKYPILNRLFYKNYS